MRHEDCPSGALLGITAILNSIFSLFHCPHWRERIPFGLGTKFLSFDLPKPLSEQLPKLPTYADFLLENDYENNFYSLREYAKTPSTALGVLTTKDAIVTLFFLVLILRQIKSFACPIFCQVGRKLGRSTHGIEWERNNEEKISKFGEYVFRLFYHSSVSIFGLWYFWSKPWWNEDQGGTRTLWENYPNQTIETGMIWYYLLQSAYNLDAVASLIQLSFVVKLRNPFVFHKKTTERFVSIEWSPTCRGDFREMAIHHIITNLLVIGSSHFRLTRIGSMVFMVHDISDVPVDLSKLANFMKWKIATIICFVSMVITWAITRLGILPFVIFKSVLLESHLTTVGLDLKSYYMWRPFFYVLFAGIIALHVFWFLLFLKIGYALAFKKEIHDYTEHKNGEQDVVCKKGQ
jgi:hypothetical protein